jgi:hypothetical protein
MSQVLQRRTLDQLTVDDESSFRHVAIYADLKSVLERTGYQFRVLPESHAGRWEDALLLNLAFWDAGSAGDVLTDARIDADVVAHVAWHWLAAQAFPYDPATGPTADALFFGEAVASAFDLYLVGRLLGHSPDALFLASQVPAMAEVAEAAGVADGAFDQLLEGVADDPDRAFEDLRELLFDVCIGLQTCRTPDDAFRVIGAHRRHRFSCLLHRFELANWALYARAHGAKPYLPDQRVRELDAQLRREREPVEWLGRQWLEPALRELAPAATGRRRV